MIEFTEIMEQAKRMCKAHSSCSQCALYHVHAGGGCAFDYLYSVSFDEVERKIRAWAAKHPDADKPERLADAEPVRRGKWEMKRKTFEFGNARMIGTCPTCNLCGQADFAVLKPTPYCPHCGAKMEN